MKPVIVTTDGSTHSLRVLPHAAGLAEALAADLELLRVVEDDDIDTQPGESAAAAFDRARDRLAEELADALREAGVKGSPRVEARLKDEGLPDAVLRSAQGAGVLAMHSRGRGGLAHILQGSVALGVLGRVALPVLLGGPDLLGSPARGGSYRILATSDLSTASEDVLRAIAPVLTSDRFHVTLFHVHEHSPGGQDNAADLARAEAKLGNLRALLPESTPVDIVVRDIPRGGGVDTAILEKADELDVAAIAMSTHGHSARRHLLAGSVTLSVLGRSPLPLIVARV